MDKCEPIPSTAVSLPIKLLKLSGGLAGLGLLLLATGCSTPEMKGTPFYTGEYSRRQGAVEQRVNVWPLLYYREPVLSVLWPVFEMTEDHTGVRPLFSVYGLDETKPQYNVLWPLAQFDQRTDDNRIVPFFWGDDYNILFPLYWHFGEPWGAQGGSDTLFPLWQLSRKGTERFSLYSPWPLVRVWENAKNDVSGSMVLPLYWHQRDSLASQFYSPLWFSAEERNGDHWRMLFPLYYEMADGKDSAFVSLLWVQGRTVGDNWRGMFPFWLYARNGDNRSDLSCPWPLAHFWSDPRHGAYGSRVLPLYWHNHEAGASQFFSLPWSGGSDTAGGWWFVPPLFYQSSNALHPTFIATLYAQGRDGATGWNTLVPLWYRSHESTNRCNFYSPLAFFWDDHQADDHGSIVLPLYWHQHQKGSSQFNSLLWMSHIAANGDSWRLLPPLFYQESTRAGSMLVTPLWAKGKSETNDWGAVIPFCYWDRRQHSLLSPLWAHWWSGDTETWLAPWTLSWRTRNPQRSDFTLLGGLARASWGEKPVADYIFPLFYNDSMTGTLLSPVWLRWREKDRETTLAPWLLSWKTRSPERSDLWLAGGLACASWGEKPGADYVIPLFYRDSQRLLTPLFGWDDEADFSYFATLLAGVRTGERSGSWVFPLYSHSRNKATGDVHDNYLLLGGQAKTRQANHSWLIPLFYYQNRFLPDSLSENADRYRSYGKNFWCLPVCWYRDQVHLRPERKPVAGAGDAATNIASATIPPETNAPFVRDDVRAHGFFPLWSYASQSTPAEGRSNQDSSVLLWLYDYKHDHGPVPGARSGVTDYTRSRVLWWLWHYEQLNGDVSVDVFPSFTYDHKTDGFKKVSFLWRCFRYERGADGDTKLDVLFLPLKR